MPGPRSPDSKKEERPPNTLIRWDNNNRRMLSFVSSIANYEAKDPSPLSCWFFVFVELNNVWYLVRVHVA